MKDDVHHPLEASGMHLRCAGHGVGIEHALPDDSQLSRVGSLVFVDAAASFGDKDVSAGEKCNRPWLTKTRNHDDLEVAMLGERRFNHEGAVP
jgi:hypothetical protein